MDFKDKLNEYIEKLDCQSKRLAEESGIAQSMISRYRNGERLPDSDKLSALAAGITGIAEKSGVSDINYKTVLADFKSAIEEKISQNNQFIANLNRLIERLRISKGALSEFLNIDPSYLYRIKKGERGVKDPEKFADDVSRFIVRFHSGDKEIIAGLTQRKITDDRSLYSAVRGWLLPSQSDSEAEMKEDSTQNFLNHLDSFDLNEYTNLLTFSKSDSPFSPEDIPPERGTYCGTEQFRKAELDFIRLTLASDSAESVLMYNDMPMNDMAEDMNFSKKWMMGLAMIMQKGITIKIIHNLDRPLDEMMLGLEGWIPLYMTGLVSPYYLSRTTNDVFCHLNYASGTAALTGECINGFHEEGRYFLFSSQKEVSYLRTVTEHIFSKANPLMKIYKKENAVEYMAFRNDDIEKKGNRRNILSSLPIHTITDELLMRILEHNDLSDNEKEDIINYAKKQREYMQTVLSHSKVTDEVPAISSEIFEEYPMSLFLADIFCEKKVFYTLDEYHEHLKLTNKFATKNENYIMKEIPFFAFRNMQIFIHEGRCVTISKNNSPTVHFVIHNPKLRKAFENMVISVKVPKII